MDRLTIINNDRPCMVFDGKRQWQISNTGREFFIYGEFADRLAAYEDTGLEPGEIEIMKRSHENLVSMYQRMEELAQADKEGRVVVLPAKEAFVLEWDAGPECNLRCPESSGFDVPDCDRCKKGKLFIYKRKFKPSYIKNIGKTVFLTREEAEKALKERAGE